MGKVLKRVGIGIAGVVGLVVVAAGVGYAVGTSKVNRTYAVQTAKLTIPTDSASLARGAHLVRTFGCVDCHGANLGGQVLEDAPPFRAVAPNLTSGRGGLAARYTPEDFDRSIRHGVKPDGRGVLIMPSAAFHRMSDQDVAAIIAHLKSAPPVDNELPPSEVRLPGRLLAAAGAVDPAAEVRTTSARSGATPPVGATLEYGEYIAGATCAHCHTSNLRGNPTPPGPPGTPPAPDLVAAVQRWTKEQFVQTLRTGTTPEGKKLDPAVMPWTITAAMQEEELAAVHMYIASLAK